MALSKKIKITLWSIAGLALVVFLIRGTILSSLVDQYVKALNAEEEIPITIAYENFRFSAVTGSLSLRGLKLSPKSIAEKKNLDLDFSAEAIRVVGIDIWKLIEQDININTIEFLEPKFHYYMKVDENGKAIREKKAEEKPKNDTTRRESPWVEALKASNLHHLVFKDGEVRLFKVFEENDTTSFVELYGYEIDLHERTYGEMDQRFTNHIRFDSLQFYLGEEFTLFTKDVYVDFNAKNVNMNNVYLKNNRVKRPYFKSLKYKKDWKEFKMDHVRLTNLDIWDIENFKFDPDSIIVDNLHIAVSEPGDIGQKPGHHGKLINDWFIGIPDIVHFNHIYVRGGNVAYEMVNAPFQGDLNIPFTIGTIQLDREEENTLAVQIKNAQIFDSPLHSKMSIRMDSSYITSVAVRVENIGNDWFNKVTMPLAGAELVRGEIELLDFHYSYKGLLATANGRMDFRYRNLKVNLAQRKEKNKKKKAWLANFCGQYSYQTQQLSG